MLLGKAGLLSSLLESFSNVGWDGAKRIPAIRLDNFREHSRNTVRTQQKTASVERWLAAPYQCPIRLLGPYRSSADFLGPPAPIKPHTYRSSTASCTPSPNLGAHGAHDENGGNSVDNPPAPGGLKSASAKPRNRLPPAAAIPPTAPGTRSSCRRASASCSASPGAA